MYNVQLPKIETWTPRVKQFVLLVLFGGVSILLAGCTLNPLAFLQQKTKGKAAEKLIESKTGGKVDINSNKLPANFPNDVPIYPGVKPVGSWSSTTKTRAGVMVTLETDDGKNEVISFYQAELPKNGWVIETTTTTNEGAMYIVKKNNRSGWVTIAAEKNRKTTIGIVLSEEKGKRDVSPSN